MPDSLFCDAVSPWPSNFVDPAEQPSSINSGCGEPNRPARFSPNREPESFERGLPCPLNRRWPSVPLAAGGDPRSMQRLRVFSSHTRVGAPTQRGLVFPLSRLRSGTCLSACPCSAVSQLPSQDDKQIQLPSQCPWPYNWHILMLDFVADCRFANPIFQLPQWSEKTCIINHPRFLGWPT